MNRIILIIIVGLIGSASAFAAGDTLVMKLKSGAIDKIPITGISTVKFENVTSVKDIQMKEASNYPNPFSNSTTIEFELEGATDADISIYDSRGNVVRNLRCTGCTQGTNKVVWDAKNNQGEMLQSGTYFFEIRTGQKVYSKKMILVK